MGQTDDSQRHSFQLIINTFQMLLEEVLFWNPCATSWLSLRVNLSAEHARDKHWHGMLQAPAACWERSKKSDGNNTSKERALRRRNRQRRETASEVFRPSMRGCTHFLPWLIKSGWGLGQLTAHLAPLKPHTHTHVCAVCQHSCIDWHGLTPFNCLWAEAVAKAESITSVVVLWLSADSNYIVLFFYIL